MKSLVLVCVFALFFAFGCSEGTTPAKTITADLLAGGLTTATITSLDCEAKDVVGTDIKTAVYKWFQMDSQRSEKGIVQDLCKTAISEIVPSLIGTAIPATWNCKQTKLDNAAETLANLACSNINK